MRLSFDIDNPDDAERAATVCHHVGDALRPKVAGKSWIGETATAPDPAPITLTLVEKPAEVGGNAPVPPTPVKEPSRARRKKPASTPASAVPDQQDAPAPNPRERLTAMARARGIVWAREVLGKYSAARLGDLLDDEVAEVLAAA
jgi:hypothetical protein